MAFSFFGKKDKNPSEAAAPVAKAPPTPPKIQTPPAAPAIPAVKPPQPSGLIPTSGMSAGAATTQPMVMPRTAGAPGGGLKPTRPGVVQSTRSTQRIVLPGAAPGKPSAGTKSLPVVGAAAPVGRINLPIGMILRCLPPEVLAANLAEFEAAGSTATEIGLPMNMILGQLPSGKVEIALADLVPHFPPGFLQPTASITQYLPMMINLPLMDVVMRIPPDLLALRPDQKGVDAAVINMADPFTEEILREQAEAARRQQAQANIIEESQVRPTEEFVPQAPPAPQPAPVVKTIAPPPRPTPNLSASGQLPVPQPAARLPGSVAPAPQPAPTAAPSLSARMISPAGSHMAPTRATAAIPARPQGAAVAPSVQMPPQSTTPIPVAPGIPRPPAPMPSAPVPPVPRQTQSLPMPPAAMGQPAAAPLQSSFVMPPMAPPMAPQPPLAAAPEPVAPEPEPQIEPEPQPLAPGVPDAAADDLQRLAALAMAQMGDGDEQAGATPETIAETVPVHSPEPVGSMAPTIPIPLPTQRLPEQETESFIEPPAPVFTAPAPVAPPAPAFVAPPAAPVAPLAPAVTPLTAPVPVAAAQVPLVATAPIPQMAQAPMPRPQVASTPPFAAVPAAPKPVAQPAPAAPAPVPVTPAVQAPTSLVNPEAVVPPAKPAEEPAGDQEAFNLNTCTVNDLMQIPGCHHALAEAIIRHRGLIGTYQKVEDLLDVPGITKEAYTSLTGEVPPPNRIPMTLNELLGFPADQQVTLKDVTDRICCWPDITGCVLSQGSGLSLVGHTPPGLDKAALVAFVPRIFETLNKSFFEVAGKETNDIIIPTPGTSYHILRNEDLYLIILCRLPQMPERHLKVARFVISALNIRKD